MWPQGLVHKRAGLGAAIHSLTGAAGGPPMLSAHAGRVPETDLRAHGPAQSAPCCSTLITSSPPEHQYLRGVATGFGAEMLTP